MELLTEQYLIFDNDSDKLKIKETREYGYLKKGNCLTIDGVDDAKQFRLLMVN
jgi:myosin heavy subunit